MAVTGVPTVLAEEHPDGSVEIWNNTEVPSNAILAALPRNMQALLNGVGRWAGNVRGQSGSRQGSLFDRDRFVTPDHVFDQMRLAYDAVESDDVVGGVLESTESLAFQRVDFHADDLDEQDIYNQIAGDIDLDSRLREMWRELFTVSQFYCGVWWTTKTYKVRGERRKKELTLRVPKALTILDPLKIVPVGMPMFNQERLAWIADRSEHERIQNRGSDPIFDRLILGPYTPTDQERRWLGEVGIDSTSLWEMNPATVFRHTATRPGYQRFASVRMKQIFELLDLKHQLRSKDRVHLVGGTNFIVLITQGSDQHPAKPEEIAHLQGSMRIVAQTPVLIGDHRLDVKIVTPTQDHTLEADRYDTVDTRIAARLYQMFTRGKGGDKTDNSEKLVKVVAAGMESRRKMLRRSLERFVLDPMFQQNDALRTPPRLQYHPKEIALAFDDAFASFLLELRTAREISRFTILNQFGISEEFEARMLEREADEYDDIFQTINPNNQGQPVGQTGAPAKKAAVKKQAAKKAAAKTPAQQRQEARRGGRQEGGRAPGTRQGQEPRGRPKAEMEEGDDDE